MWLPISRVNFPFPYRSLTHFSSFLHRFFIEERVGKDVYSKDDLGNRSIVSVSTLQELVFYLFLSIFPSFYPFSILLALRRGKKEKEREKYRKNKENEGSSSSRKDYSRWIGSRSLSYLAFLFPSYRALFLRLALFFGRE